MALIQLRGVEPQLIKTTVNRCLFDKVVIILKIFPKTLVYVKISCIFTP